MSIEAVSLVLNQSRATGRAKLVLLGIANHLGDHGAWPSISTLARYANASERSVKRDIQELVQLGELKVELQNAPTRHQYKTNLYWITIGSGVTDSAPGVTDWVSRGDSSGKSGVTPVGTQNINITIKEPSLKSDLESFETFWLLYPKKVAKADAVKAWRQAIKRKPAEEIIELAKQYAQTKLPAIEYIPNGSTWLNNNRWEDVEMIEKPKPFKFGVEYK
jgi:AraC-like DNA-binding protein